MQNKIFWQRFKNKIILFCILEYCRLYMVPNNAKQNPKTFMKFIQEQLMCVTLNNNADTRKRLNLLSLYRIIKNKLPKCT